MILLWQRDNTLQNPKKQAVSSPRALYLTNDGIIQVPRYSKDMRALTEVQKKRVTKLKTMTENLHRQTRAW